MSIKQSELSDVFISRLAGNTIETFPVNVPALIKRLVLLLGAGGWQNLISSGIWKGSLATETCMGYMESNEHFAYTKQWTLNLEPLKGIALRLEEELPSFSSECSEKGHVRIPRH